MRVVLLLAGVLWFVVLSAATEITLGGYVSFRESTAADPATPGYYSVWGRAAYEPLERFFVGGDFFFLQGFPEKGSLSSGEETSYLRGRPRLVLQYDFPRVKIGLVSYAILSSPSDEYAQVIFQGPAISGGYRQYYLQEELYVKAAPIENMHISAAIGVNGQSFDIDPPLGSGIIRDTNLFAMGDVRYRIFPLFEPFVSLSHTDDLNAQDTFDLFRFAGGFRGEELFFDKDMHLSYTLFYKREEADPLTNKNRLGVSLKGRWNFASGTDLFGWFYHEYAIAPVRYVSRSMTLQLRQWLFDRKLALSAGSMLLVEKHLGGDWYLPVWPFFEIRGTPIVGLDILVRLHLKFDEQITSSAKWQYRLFQTRIEAGSGYLIAGIVQPQLFFFMNVFEGRTIPDSLGLKCMATVFF